MTQERLAERSGLTVQFLSRLETNDRVNPSISTLVAISNALGPDVELASLLEPPVDDPELPEKVPPRKRRPRSRRR